MKIEQAAVIACQPLYGPINPAVHGKMMSWMSYNSPRAWVRGYIFKEGAYIDWARNYLVAFVLREWPTATHIFFIDQDMELPSEVVPRLVENDVDVASAVYFGKNEDATIVAYGEGERLQDFDETKLQQVPGVGMGACLIKTDLLRRMALHFNDNQWFRSEEKGEDKHFADRCKAMGVPIYLDGRLQCGHYDDRVITKADWDRARQRKAVLDDLGRRVLAVLESIKQASLEQLRSIAFVAELIRRIPDQTTQFRGLQMPGVVFLQIPEELAEFLIWVSQWPINSLLEVGTWGGINAAFMTAYLLRFNPALKAVTIDPYPRLLPAWPDIKLPLEHRRITSDDLIGQSFDLVFIDGDHSQDAVKKDWLNVGQHAKLCAFHDIDEQTLATGAVPTFWRELRAVTCSKEFIKLPGTMGIGLVDNTAVRMEAVA